MSLILLPVLGSISKLGNRPSPLGRVSMATIDAEPYPFDLIPPHAGLVIIDMQRDFLEPGGFGAALGNDVSLLRAAVAPCRDMLGAARRLDLLVIHTKEC